MIRLYYDPAATTCRPILMFAAETGLALEYSRVDLFAGQHRTPPFPSINANCAVPVLEDDGFVLTESSAILKYLAEASDAAAYPADLQQRARINEMMDWFNTGFMRAYCYGLVYSQVLPDYRLGEPANSQILAMSRKHAEEKLAVLDGLIDGKPFLCGSRITLADYFGASLMSLGEIIDFDLSRWPNVARWMKTMHARPHWQEANAGIYAWKSVIQTMLQRSA